jgi:hypothetical protein
MFGPLMATQEAGGLVGGLSFAISLNPKEVLNRTNHIN